MQEEVFCARESQDEEQPREEEQLGLGFRVEGLQLLYINVQRFRGGLVCKAHGLVYHSTLGLRVIKKKKKKKPRMRNSPARNSSWV